MIKKILRIVVCLGLVCCLLCNFTGALATAEIPDISVGDGEEIIIQATETQTKEESGTQKDPEPSTEHTTAGNTKEPSKETTTKIQTTEALTDATKANATPSSRVTTTRSASTAAETTEEQLPDGAFYVYLELNNGQDRLKTRLDKPGLVPEADEPKREGYVFDGWYKDEEFTEIWDFFTDYATEGTVIYAKWVADAGTVVYNIKITQSAGGTLQANPANASVGELVTITVIPEDGKRLLAGSLLINGEPTDVFSFVMPAGEVTITASFEDIPVSQPIADDGGNFIVIVLILLAIAIVALVIIIIIIKRRNTLRKDAITTSVGDDDDDDIVWIDDSIIVEDGFKNGQKVSEDTKDSEEDR